MTAQQLSKNELSKRPLRKKQENKISNKTNKNTTHSSEQDRPSTVPLLVRKSNHIPLTPKGSEIPKETKTDALGTFKADTDVGLQNKRLSLRSKGHVANSKAKSANSPNEVPRLQTSSIRYTKKQHRVALDLTKTQATLPSELFDAMPNFDSRTKQSKEETSTSTASSSLQNGARSSCPPGTELVPTTDSQHSKCKATSRHLTSSGAKLVPGIYRM